MFIQLIAPKTFFISYILLFFLGSLTFYYFKKNLKQKYVHLKNNQEQRDKLIRFLGHDINNPLSVIFAASNILESHESIQTTDQKILFEIEENSEKIQNQVSKIRLFKALESGKKQLQLKKVNLKDALLKAIHEIEMEKNDKEIKINLFFQNENLFSLIDEQTFINHILTPILANAVKYSPCHSMIDVHLKTKKHFCFLEIIDRGIGIPKKNLPFVFDFNKSGLSLPLAKILIQKMKGKIHIRSHEGTTSVTLLFKRYENDFHERNFN